jgi:hypothetical protein
VTLDSVLLAVLKVAGVAFVVVCVVGFCTMVVTGAINIAKGNMRGGK